MVQKITKADQKQKCSFLNKERRIFISIVKKVQFEFTHSNSIVLFWIYMEIHNEWKSSNDRSFVQFISFHFIVAFLCLRREKKDFMVKKNFEELSVHEWCLKRSSTVMSIILTVFYLHIVFSCLKDTVFLVLLLLLSLWILREFVWSDIQEVYCTFIKKILCHKSLAGPNRTELPSNLYRLTC